MGSSQKLDWNASCWDMIKLKMGFIIESDGISTLYEYNVHNDYVHFINVNILLYLCNILWFTLSLNNTAY